MRGRARVIAIKQNVDLCPWADMVYGCDAAWWRFRKGLPEFNGLKVCWSGSGIREEYPGLLAVEIAKDKLKVYSDDLKLAPLGTIGGGSNSGFQALNIAVQLGARRVILVGFDMSDRSGKHWYGRNHWPKANNPDESNFLRWIAAFNKAAPVLAGLGIQVFNTSPNSALRCFPLVDLKQALGAADHGMAGLRSA